MPDFAQTLEDLSSISTLFEKYDYTMGASLICMILEEFCLFHDTPILNFVSGLLPIISEVQETEGRYTH